ncbi:MAG: XdhC family protein [Coriobacteriales bacterium]|jgi:xanthine dehydrogenase accessory factor|nr:XdhC family protein [Coriobacteriales bacterium]
MAVDKLYAQLLDVLDFGEAAAVVSVYKEGGGVTKRVLSATDANEWAQIERFLTQPDTLSCGPVAHSMAADGTLTVLERYTARPRLIILGGGHVALALAQIASLVDFEIVVYDDRPSFANAARFAMANEVICDGFDQLFRRVRIKRTDYVVIVTRGHKHDSDCLAGILAGTEPVYTGMIGSKRRVAIVKTQLKEAGFAAEKIGRIHSPIGLDIGGITPAEIAISIIAQLISVRRQEGAADELLSCDLAIVAALANPEYTPDALITIYHTRGSVPIDTGAKLAMTYAGATKGTIGGGCSESDAMQVARDVIRAGSWRRHMLDMRGNAEQDGMVCGGEMYVVIEPT